MLTADHGERADLVGALASLAPHADPAQGVHLQLAQQCPYRRVIKTHLPLSLLPQDLLDTCKVPAPDAAAPGHPQPTQSYYLPLWLVKSLCEE